MAERGEREREREREREALRAPLLSLLQMGLGHRRKGEGRGGMRKGDEMEENEISGISLSVGGRGKKRELKNTC